MSARVAVLMQGRLGRVGTRADRRVTTDGQTGVEHEPALDLARLDEAMRLDSLSQPEDTLDAGRDPACFEQVEEL